MTAVLALAPPAPDPRRLRHLLVYQHGVISRDQVLSCGYEATEIRRRVRRNEWSRVHPGVFIHHTGPLTLIQRAWAAVLSSWPAALAGESAWRAAGGPGRFEDTAPIHIAVDRQRRLTAPDGVTLRPTSRLPIRVQWDSGPPRMRSEDVVLDLAASDPSLSGAFAWLADALQARMTTPERLLQAAKERPQLPRRRLLAAFVRDLQSGTCFALAYAYLSQVEAAHGLPRPARRPASVPERPGFSAALYPAYAVVIELDGRVGRASIANVFPARARALPASVVPMPMPVTMPVPRPVPASRTLVLGWPQVLGTPCHSARLIATALRQHGWEGALLQCPRCAPQPRMATPSRQ